MKRNIYERTLPYRQYFLEEYIWLRKKVSMEPHFIVQKCSVHMKHSFSDSFQLLYAVFME